MTAVDYILEGLARALEVERTCGLRQIEIDRELIKPTPASSSQAAPAPQPASAPQPAPVPPPASAASQPATSTLHPFVFLHDRPLSPAAITMMSKIIGALHETAESTPIVFTGDRPAAKIYVVLGLAALNKWFPNLHLTPNTWGCGDRGEPVLLVKSPEEIVRFKTVTSAVDKIKHEMWAALKSVLKRLPAIG